MNRRQLAEAIAELEATADSVQTLVLDIDPARRVVRPPSGTFSILENVWHMRDIETEGYLVRIGRLLAEDDPFLPDLDGSLLATERRYNERDLADGLEGFRSARLASTTALKLSGAAALERSGTLDTVGPITLGDLVEKMLEHDRGHLEELADLRRTARQTA